MQDHVYKMIELAGSSESSIEDAIQNAVARAAKTLHDLRWFEVVENSRPHRERPRRALPGRDQGRLHRRRLSRPPPAAGGRGPRSSRSLASARQPPK